MKVLSFGEIIWDTYTDHAFIGGAPLNFAAHFVRCGGESYLCSAVGQDATGTETLRMIQEMGIHTDYIVQNEKPTGRCLVTLDAHSVPHYQIVEDVAYDVIAPPTEIAAAASFDAFYFGTLALRSRHNRSTLETLLARGSFPNVFVDINIRQPYISQESLLFAFQHATILKISDEELPIAAALADIDAATPQTAAQDICRRFGNVRLVILTLGAKGALVYDARTQDTVQRAAQKVNVVSTVGAGDSFSAAFLSRYLCGESIETCLAFATAVSGFVVANRAAIPPYHPSQFQ